MLLANTYVFVCYAITHARRSATSTSNVVFTTQTVAFMVRADRYNNVRGD